ncbi:MAG TPA: recombinase family protein, partial [Stellaceae bacterium]|nr:recombinase family protein [Stellaceae bacterium]
MSPASTKRNNRATAYSYLRFSTPDQLKGDSFRRQTELSQHYAEEHGLDLDDKLTFHDLGVSGFRGKNVTKGALGDFIKAIDTGRVQSGSYLLVESLDRLSRDTVMNAFNRFQDILSKGVTIVTLQDGKAYTARSLNESFGDLMVSLTIMFRANEESATKARRMKAAWQAKRKRASENGEKLTSRCPSWLQLDRVASGGRNGAFKVNSKRADILRRIFDLTINGHGKGSIARMLNREGVPAFGGGKGWYPSSIQNLLESEATFGVFRPMREDGDDASGLRRRVAEGEPIRDYFPAVISEDTFLLAKKARQGRRIAITRKTERMANLFTGLARCGVCDAPMHLVTKGTKSGRAVLVCSNARRGVGGCRYASWHYPLTERFIIETLEELDLRELFPSIYKTTETTLQALTKAKATADARLEKAKAESARVVELLVSRPTSEALLARLDEAEKAVRTLTEEVQRLAQDTAAEARKLKDAERDHHDARTAMKELRRVHRSRDARAIFDLRVRLHQLLRRTISAIKFTPARDRE